MVEGWHLRCRVVVVVVVLVKVHNVIKVCPRGGFTPSFLQDEFQCPPMVGVKRT